MTNLNGKLIFNSITNAVAKNVYLLSRLRRVYNSEACNTFFVLFLFLRSHYVQINYVSNVWDGCSDVHIKKRKAVHKRAVKVLCAASPSHN